MLWDPFKRRPAYFVMIGHSFGHLASVYNYNRRASIVTDILVKLFHLFAFNYYDDKFGFTTDALVSEEIALTAEVHTWLGIDFSARKLQAGQEIDVLGVSYDFVREQLRVAEARKAELTSAIADVLRADALEPGPAGKLRGKLGFVSGHYRGRFGRSFLRALSERQYAKPRQDWALGPALQLSLSFWQWLLARNNEVRALYSRDADKTVDVIIFTDGYCPEAAKGEAPLAGPGRIGWVAFFKQSGEVFVGSHDIAARTGEEWLPRKNQINMVELFAPPVVFDVLEHRLRSCRVLLFVDSEAAEGALIKGYSKFEDVCELAGLFWHMAVRANAAVYVDRVSTDGNPADGPSRGDVSELTARGAIQVSSCPGPWLMSRLAWREGVQAEICDNHFCALS